MRTTALSAAAIALALGCATSGSPGAPPAAAGTRGAPARSAGAASDPAATAAPPAGDTITPRAQRLFDEAVASVEEQHKLKVPLDWALLERKWRNVLDEVDLAEARYNLGVALERQGKLAEAADAYRRAVALKPGFRQAAVNLAVLLERTSGGRSAADAYARIARDFPEDAVSRERLAALYLSAGQADEAWRLAREALLRDAGSVGAQKVMARVALQRNDLDLGKLLVLRAQKLDERDPELPFLAGQIAAREGDDKAAVARWRRAVELDDGYAPARVALLDAALRAESWVNVAAEAKEVLRLDPRNASAELALGIAQRHLGKPDEALASYDKAERLSGGALPEVHYARGILLMKVKGECEPAIEEFKAYARSVGPVLRGDAPVFKLQRECEQTLEENRRAAEAARRIQAEAAREAAEPARPGATTPAQGGRPAPTSAPTPR
jgi:tetratricopeptide (TPR) repeat protein